MTPKSLLSSIIRVSALPRVLAPDQGVLPPCCDSGLQAVCLDSGASHFDLCSHSHGNRRREKHGGSTSNCKRQPGKRHMLLFALHKPETVTWPRHTLQMGNLLLCKPGNRKERCASHLKNLSHPEK